jgi:DNA-binding transcriptional MerR regulator
MKKPVRTTNYDGHVVDLLVGAMARALGKSEDTIRDLERRGVIRARRDSAGRRIFRPDQLNRAREHYNKRRA